MNRYPRGTRLVLLAARAQLEPGLKNLFAGGIDLSAPLRPEHEDTVRRIAYHLNSMVMEFDQAAAEARARRSAAAQRRDPSTHRKGGWHNRRESAA